MNNELKQTLLALPEVEYCMQLLKDVIHLKDVSTYEKATIIEDKEDSFFSVKPKDKNIRELSFFNVGSLSQGIIVNKYECHFFCEKDTTAVLRSVEFIKKENDELVVDEVVFTKILNEKCKDLHYSILFMNIQNDMECEVFLNTYDNGNVFGYNFAIDNNYQFKKSAIPLKEHLLYNEMKQLHHLVESLKNNTINEINQSFFNFLVYNKDFSKEEKELIHLNFDIDLIENKEYLQFSHALFKDTKAKIQNDISKIKK